MSRIDRTTLANHTVSTVVMDDGRAEVMVFGHAEGDEVDSIRVPRANARKAHAHMVRLWGMGSLASYYSKSAGESVARAALRGSSRVISF